MMIVAHLVFNLEAEWPVQWVRRTMCDLRGAAGCVLSSSVCGGLLCNMVLHLFPEASPICRLTECIIIFYVDNENHKDDAPFRKAVCVFMRELLFIQFAKKYKCTGAF